MVLAFDILYFVLVLGGAIVAAIVNPAQDWADER